MSRFSAGIALALTLPLAAVIVKTISDTVDMCQYFIAEIVVP